MSSSKSGPRRPTLRERLEYRGLVAPRVVPPDAWLSQYGDEAFGFREIPRFDRPDGRIETAVSMFVGSLTAEQVYRAMMGIPPKASKGPKVRRFVAARLTDAGYGVVHEGAKPDHVAVGPPAEGEDLAKAKAWWNNPARATLATLYDELEEAKSDG